MKKQTWILTLRGSACTKHRVAGFGLMDMKCHLMTPTGHETSRTLWKHVQSSLTASKSKFY